VLDFINSTLIACQDREFHSVTPQEGEEIESSELSSFPLSYRRGVQAMDPTKPPPKEKRRAYPTDCQGCVPYEESSVAAGPKQVCQNMDEEEGDATLNEAHSYLS